MPTGKKIFIGGLGALTPILMNLLVVDFRALQVNITTYSVIGYILRVIILFYLGGLIAFFHKDEKSPVKLFQLGIAAPALITAFINAGNVEVPKATAQGSGTPISIGMLIPSAYAQTSQPLEIRKFSHLEESQAQQLFRGLTGSISQKVWFVIESSYTDLEGAKAEAEKVTNSKGGYNASVYAPYENNQLYSVVIGRNLTRLEAEELKRKAITDGLSKDTHVWTFPK
jgi:hypothetical protein